MTTSVTASPEICPIELVSAACSGDLKVLEHHAKACARHGRALMECAAREGQAAVVGWLHAGGCALHPGAMDLAMYARKLGTVKLMHQRGAALGAHLFDIAAFNDDVDAAAWLAADRRALQAALEAPSLRVRSKEMFSLLANLGRHWTAADCAWFADVGEITLLAAARNYGAVWDSRVAAAAVRRGDAELLRYAVRHGCPLDEQTAASLGLTKS